MNPLINETSQKINTSFKYTKITYVVFLQSYLMTVLDICSIKHITMEKIIIAQLSIKDTKTEAFLKLAESMINNSITENGCITYKLLKDVNNKTDFFIYRRCWPEGGGGQGGAHSSAQPSPVHCLRESNTLRNPRGRSPYFILRIVAFLTILRCNQPFSSCELVILVVFVPLKALVPFQSLHPILFSPFSSCAFWRGLGARC